MQYPPHGLGQTALGGTACNGVMHGRLCPTNIQNVAI